VLMWLAYVPFLFRHSHVVSYNVIASAIKQRAAHFPVYALYLLPTAEYSTPADFFTLSVAKLSITGT
jgi:hypothetical protein